MPPPHPSVSSSRAVVDAAICDVMAVGNNKAIQFEHGVGLVQALASHGLHSWIERSEPDDGQHNLNRLGKLLEGVFKVPEAKMAGLGYGATPAPIARRPTPLTDPVKRPPPCMLPKWIFTRLPPDMRDL